LERVNVDDALLSSWLSEDITSNTDEPLDGECSFYNFSRSFTSPFCDPFAISRMHKSTINAASDRALKCAAKYSVECILSPEIGFAVPVAFVGQHGASEGMKAVVAPRILHTKNTTQDYVRITTPTDTLNTFTTKFNSTVTVEYMTSMKTVQTSTFSGDAAFCIQLLRVAFESACWENLDRG